MHATETKEKFIVLRAKDWSFDRIAEELGVHRTTLIRWQQEFGAQIHNLQQIEFERIQEKLLGSKSEQFESLVNDYLRYRRELESRQPQHIPQYMLFRMVSRLRDQVERRKLSPQFLPEPAQPPTQENLR
jgi:hypothetical protein